jgi:NAD(P) transhydrogenase subunit alpha
VRITVPSQHEAGERRVAITPDVARRLVQRGHVVAVESGAGVPAGHDDVDYEAVGAQIVDREQAWSGDLVATVGRPPPETPVRGAVLGLLRPFDDPAGLAELASGGATLFAFEAVPRTTRAQVVDALSSQATALGYRGAVEAAARIDRLFPMLTTAAGTIRPAKVLVLGAGVAGLQALATARRLGAAVSAFDVRPEAAEEIRSIGATCLQLDLPAPDGSAAGADGHDDPVDDDPARLLAALAPHVAAADVIITAAAVPGRRAPLLIDDAMVASMRRGAVIVDLAAPTGGNCTATRPGLTIEVDGVTIVGDTDLVSRVAGDASAMFARNVAAFVELVTGDDGRFVADWDDDIVAESCVARDGVLIHPHLVDTPPEEAS